MVTDVYRFPFDDLLLLSGDIREHVAKVSEKFDHFGGHFLGRKTPEIS